jgi:C-terminal processing protease CtpA/Prc
MRTVLTCLVLFFSASIFAQATPNQDLNLSFEKTDSAGHITGCSYQWAKDGYYTYKDDSVKIDGANSIRIQNETITTEEKFASVTFSLPANFSAKKITLKGFIKTENVNNGYAGLWLRSDAGNNPADFGNLGESAPKGSADWKSYSTSIKMDKGVTKLVFGGLLAGSGKAWFDKFELYADDKPIDIVEWQVLKTPNVSVKSNVRLDSLLTNKQKENLYILAKVWGFLKYHHPDVARGKSSFDEELFKVLRPIANAGSAEKRNELLLNWMNSLGDETTYKTTEQLPEKDIHIRPDLSWISNKALFSEAVIDKLNSIYSHRNRSDNAYIKLMPGVLNPNFDGEQRYTAMAGDDDGLRMLALFRYWNIIEYFFPSKYLIRENWDHVLQQSIPVFAADRTSLAYKLNCLKLINRIHDTHASISGDKDLGAYFGINYTVVKARMIQGKLIVTLIVDSALAEKESIKVGDEILSVNGKTIAQCHKDMEGILCASNPSAADRNFASAFLLRGNGDSLAITYDHDGVIKNGSLKLYPMQTVNAASMKKYYSGPTYKFLNDSIGYITLATIKASELKPIFKTFENTKGIVIDIRNYPSEFMPFAMAEYIKPAPSPFVKFTNGNIDNPGFFTFKYSISNGSKNKDHYKGKIVILVDERSQSQAEYTTMALRTAPNAIVMGSQTAGADGNVSMIYFPGGFGSYISGIGVFYPDGKETQGIGIVPDIEVKPTREGIKNGTDELLEKAMQYISGKK